MPQCSMSPAGLGARRQWDADRSSPARAAPFMLSLSPSALNVYQPLWVPIRKCTSDIGPVRISLAHLQLRHGRTNASTDPGLPTTVRAGRLLSAAVRRQITSSSAVQPVCLDLRNGTGCGAAHKRRPLAAPLQLLWTSNLEFVFGIPDRVGQLVLDEVGPEAQHLVQNGPRHRPERAPQRGVAHRPLPVGIARIREDVATVTGQSVNLAKNRDRLTRQGHDARPRDRPPNRPIRTRLRSNRSERA